jgi:MoaA/NifB/PqqE/SkfB family radical SAM enzyme
MAPRYYLPETTHNPLRRLHYRYIQRRKPLLAAPKAVQIQTVSGCNANCVFCPNKKTKLEIPLGKIMDEGLYRNIVDQCVDMGVQRFSPYLMNESMLDQKLPDRIQYITSRKKDFQYTKINSHGGLLTERMAKGILDAGLDRLNFSVQGLDPDIYFRIMNLKLEKTIANIERFIKMKSDGGYKTRVRVVLLDTVEVNPQLPKIREFWADRGIKVNVNQLENRGNHQGIQSDSIAVHELQNFDWCNRMFEQIYVLFDGRLVQCCADWEQSAIMGDMSREHLRSIWQGRRYTDYRRRFLEGDVKGMLCDGCTKDSVDQDDDE